MATFTTRLRWRFAPSLAGATVEALLGQRLDIGAQLLARRVQPEAAKIGINILAVEVRDMVLPADLKRAFGDVLKAKQEGHAASERARGESAALRNLANAARDARGQSCLDEPAPDAVACGYPEGGQPLVLGVLGGFVPLKQEGKTIEPERQGANNQAGGDGTPPAFSKNKQTFKNEIKS